MDTLTIEEATNTLWLYGIKRLTPVEVIAVRPLPLNVCGRSNGWILKCGVHSTVTTPPPLGCADHMARVLDAS